MKWNNPGVTSTEETVEKGQGRQGAGEHILEQSGAEQTMTHR